jgi:hypothetical protein
MCKKERKNVVRNIEDALGFLERLKAPVGWNWDLYKKSVHVLYMSTFLYLQQFKRTTCIYYDKDPIVIHMYSIGTRKNSIMQTTVYST